MVVRGGAVGNTATRPLEISLFHKSKELHLTVLDNVLLLHDVLMKASMMYDIKLSVNCPVIPPCAVLPPLNAKAASDPVRPAKPATRNSKPSVVARLPSKSQDAMCRLLSTRDHPPCRR
eukprot:SAG22_NODE_4423_length_1273_cov_1.853492_1_plen_119_part_00